MLPLVQALQIMDDKSKDIDIANAFAIGWMAATKKGNASRFKGEKKKRLTAEPGDIRQYVRQGGIRAIEYAAAAKAAEEAVRFERESWLPTLQGWLELCESDKDMLFCFGFELKRDIKHIKRCLAIHPTPEERREKCKLRVRKHREAKRAAVS
jgi:hypothetical protein